MTVVIAPEALEDLTAAVEYIAGRNPQAAARLGEAVFATIDRLAEGAFDGPEQRLRSGELVRSWPVPPLRVYYQRVGERFVVLRVYHQARRPITP